MMSKEEAIEFDKNLDIYIGRNIYLLKNKIFYEDPKIIDNVLTNKNFKLNKWNLDDFYDYANIGNDDRRAGKLFAMLLDLKITLVECMNLYYEFMKINNAIINIKSNNILIYKIQAHDTFVNFVFRYRALWDKIMGCLVFVYFDEKTHSNFLSADSKKGRFKELFEDGKAWSMIKEYFDNLENFDNVYRTPEAHQTGKARKEAIFNKDRYLDSEYFKTIVELYFNPLINFINIFGQLLNFAKTHEEYYLSNIIIEK